MKWHLILSKSIHGEAPMSLQPPRLIKIEGYKIGLVKLADTYYAFADRCPHAGGSLSAGFCKNDKHIVCPLHRHHYNLKDGRGLQGDYIDIFPVREDDQGVWLGIPEPKPWWKFWE